MTGVYSIQDKKSGIFHQPFFARNTTEALRHVRVIMTDTKQNFVAMFPDDYALFNVGAWSDQDGAIVPTPDGRPILLEHCINLVPPAMAAAANGVSPTKTAPVGKENK